MSIGLLSSLSASEVLIASAFLFGALSGISISRFAASLRSLDIGEGGPFGRVANSSVHHPDTVFLAFRIAFGFAGVTGVPRVWAVVTALLIFASMLASTFAVFFFVGMHLP